MFKVIIGRAPYRSDQSGATPSSRSDLPIRATLPERQGRVARVLITRSARTSPERPLAATQRGRSRSMERLHGATGKSRLRFDHPETRERVRSDLSQQHSEVAPEAWSDLSERRAEVAARLISARTYDFSRAFWSFHYARFYFLNLCFNTL